jgi:hypothetical protein
MPDVRTSVDDRLELVVETGPDYPEGGNHLCYVTILCDGEELARINSPSKPWKHFTKVMVRNIIVKRLDEYDSDEQVDSLLETAFRERKAELDDIYGWE